MSFRLKMDRLSQITEQRHRNLTMSEDPVRKRSCGRKMKKLKRLRRGSKKFVKESLEKEEDDPADENAVKVLWVNPQMPLQ